MWGIEVIFKGKNYLRLLGGLMLFVHDSTQFLEKLIDRISAEKLVHRLGGEGIVEIIFAVLPDQPRDREDHAVSGGRCRLDHQRHAVHIKAELRGSLLYHIVEKHLGFVGVRDQLTYLQMAVMQICHCDRTPYLVFIDFLDLHKISIINTLRSVK